MNLIETISARFAESPEHVALIFVDRHGKELETYTYREFWEISCSIAVEIQADLKPGERVVLALTSGPATVLTFFGCLCAGVLPVITTPSRHRNDQSRGERLANIVRATEPRRLYVSAESASAIDSAILPADCRQIVLDEHTTGAATGLPTSGADLWRHPDIDDSSPAYIQFTSGSTGKPRGVLLSHSNVVSNLAAIRRVFRHDKEFRGFSWLPLHHDMGLVGHVLEPLSTGASSILAPPSLFSAHPLAWLRCISRYRATDSGAPPFAYRMCSERQGEIPADLDLSCWRNAYCGAETVPPDLLEQFAARFATHGFDRSAFLPCYGLAETTLLAAGGREFIHDAGRLSYALLPEVGIRVLHPETNDEVAPGEPGEICVSGSCVGRALGEDAEMRDVFVTSHGVATRFLRTGDMGAASEGRLRLMGRKDGLMIVRGVKYYSEDVESVVAAAPATVGEGTSVCFAVPGTDTSEIVVIQEIRRTRAENFREVAARIHSAVSDGCGLNLSAVVLVRRGGILRTSSGKVARAANRDAWLLGETEPLFVLRQPEQARDRSRDIAVIGMACRFPKAPDLDTFWELLSSGVDAIDEVPADRWNWRDYYSPEVAPGKMNTRWGGFLDGVYEFDAAFFGIPDHEAIEMDPQQRLVLEVAWRALEHAGIPIDQIRGSNTGVFVGVSTMDYLHLQIKARNDLTEFSAYTSLGAAHSIAANRLSYVLDLHGPSLAVDTACSSSLTAIHMAIQSLRNGECDMAIAGGVNVILSPGTTVALSQFNMMAPDGRCKAFDSRADGYVRSEGCGLVVLRRSADATESGARILAWVRGSALTQDGRTRGITAPNEAAQARAIQGALRDAACAAGDITLVEAHGTGTAAGDPAEMNELRRQYGAAPSSSMCPVGSVKANIGHLESAAGVAGFIKLVLSLNHREIPPQIQIENLHPEISLKESRLTIPFRRTPWAVPAQARRIGALSSFGFGGANAHMIIEEGESLGMKASPEMADRPELFLLSAATEKALHNVAQEWTRFLGRDSVPAVSVLARAQAMRRTHFSQRASFVAGSTAELRNELTAFCQLFPRTKPGAAATAGIVFLFGGHGTQYAGMGRELAQQFPVFQRALRECSDLFAECGGTGRSLLECGVLEDEAAYDDPVLQAAGIFSFQYALSRTWEHLGITPAAVLGHSLGEYAAACVAGCFDLADALHLVTARAHLIASIARPGGMAAVMAPAQRVREILDREGLDPISLAADNSPEAVTISGNLESLVKAEGAFQTRAIATRRLRTLQAFHSQLLDEILPQFEETAARVRFQKPRIPLISNLTGRLLDTAPDAVYWRRHLREPVLFRQGIETARAAGLSVFLDSGPGDTLTNLAHRCSPDSFAVYSATDARQEAVSVLRAAGRLYTLGASLSWQNLYRDAPSSYGADLPGHPFYRRHYFFANGIPEVTESESGESAWNGPETDLPAEYDVQWIASEMTPRKGADTVSDPDEVWILIGGRPADEMALRLVRERKSVFQISPSPEIRQRYNRTTDRASGATRFLVAPGCSSETYGAIFQEIASRLMRADAGRWNVVCLNALECCPTARTSVASLEHDQDAHGTGDLLSIVQGLIRIVILKRLWIVTENAQHVPQGADNIAENAVNVAQSAIWGFALTVFLEHPDMRGALIDLPSGQAPAEQTGAILDSIAAQDGEPLMAFRGGVRCVPRLTKLENPSQSRPRTKLRSDGTYVITGGLGGLGLQSAMWMAECGAGRIVLAGRRGLPDSATWPDLASNTEEGRKVDAVRRIEALGAAVEVRSLDITDHAAVAAMIQDIGRGPYPLRGILHAAGVNWFAKVMDMDRARTLETLKIKISAAWNLHELSRGAELDFFILYSSVSSLWGSVSLSHYTAANGFMDALAWYRKQQGLPALSINWGPWSDAGMSAGYEEASVLTKLGFRLMTPQRALRGMERALTSGQTQLAIADIRWEIFQSVVNFSFAPVFFSRVSSESSRRARFQSDRAEAARIRELPEEEAREQLIATVKRLLASVLLLEPGAEVDVRQRFNLMGMDSLAAVAFALRIEAFAGVRMPTALAWNYPTVLEVADHLCGILRDSGSSEKAGAAEKILSAPTGARQEAPAQAWFRKFSSQAIDAPPERLRLICLPYAGAGASVYREWSDQLADVCEAIAVQLPGREERMAEGVITDMARLASLLADALKSLPRARFAIFGHSMGALLAFELTRELRARGADMPAALLVSACPAPGSATGGGHIRNLPDNEFRRRAIEAFDVPASAAADSEVWKSLLPVLRADVTLMENYTPAEEPALNVPITAFGARADSAVSRQHLLAWSGVTSADYSLHMFDGGHMFVHDRAFPLVLREELRKLETSPTLDATGR